MALFLTACGSPSGTDGGKAGPPTQLTASGGSGTGTVGQQVASPPSIVVRDVSNRAVSGVPVTFAVTAGGGSVTGATQTTNASGVATVGSWTLGTAAGQNTLTVTSSSVSGAQTTINVIASAAAANQMAANGSSSGGTVGALVASPPGVLVADAFGNPVSGVSVTFTVASGGGTLSGGTQSTNSSGIARASSWTLGTAAGSNSVTATSAGLTGSPLTITALAAAAAPSQLAPSGGSTAGTAGAPVTQPPSVLVRDGFNNPVSGAAVTFTVTSGGGSITGGNQVTNAGGVATVGSWTLGSAGENSLGATVAGLAGPPLVFTATATSSGADYIVSVMTAPATGTVGSTITVLATTRNQGNSAGGPFRVGFYFSTDATITTSDFFSGWSCNFETGLPANTSVDCSGPIGVPSNLPPGTYFVGAVTDDVGEVTEGNEANNARAATNSTVISQAVRPDLVVDAATAPATGTPGSTVNLLGTVRNAGTAASGAFRLGFYVSNDAIISTSDTFFASCTYANGLAANAASDCSGAVTVPASLPSGTYYIGVIADDQGQVTEISETNNTRASNAIVIAAAAKPDFVIDNLTAPATGTVGGTVTVSARVRNQGTNAGPFRMGFYFSTDATITTADVFSGSVCTYDEGLAGSAFDDCSGAITVPGTLAAGTYFVGAIADDEGVVTETLENNNTRAAANSTVISGPGTGTALDLLIDGMYVTQSSQSYSGTVPLVANRTALLRVFVKATQANTATPTVRARFYSNGTLVDTRTINAPGASVPTAITEGTLSSSWNVDISSLIQPGLSILVDVDPTNAIVESNESDNTFPLNGTAKVMDVRTVSTYNVTLVPVVQAPNQLRGDVTEANKGTYLDFAMRVYPLATSNAVVHAPYNYASSINNNYDNTWTTLLNEMTALRALEGSQRRYYGILKPGYTSGGTGLGTISGNAAIGVDWSGAVTGTNTTLRSMTAAHEWGHNFGRLHVNCGDPAGPDPNYPYLTTSVGAFGYDITRNALIPASTFADLMTYCTPLWISDYNYKAVLNYRAANPSSLVADAPQRGLLVWGHIDANGVVLEPAFEVDAPPSLPARAGPYSVRATDATGQELFTLAFEGEPVDHMPGARQFAYVVPLPAGAATRASSVSLGANGLVTTRRSAAASIANADLPQVSRTVRFIAGTGTRSRLEWDSARYPMVLVRDPVTREVLAFARGGRTDLDVAARTLDLTLSDGAASVQLTVTRTP